MKKLFFIVFRNKILSTFLFSVSILIPNFNKLKKYKNAIRALYSFENNKISTLGNPITVRIAPIALCNYRCLFCEIHKDNILYPDRSKNAISLMQIKNFEFFLSTSYSLSFYGGSEEPLLNNNMGEIVKYLKRKYKIKLFVNTNASMLSQKLSDIFLQYRFDYILVSYHAGKEDSYKRLMTGNMKKVDENILYLTKQKKDKNKFPIIDFNFALHKMNSDEYVEVLDKAKNLGARGVVINKYYGGRNKIQDNKVSFDYDIATGNKVLDEIYSYGKKNDIGLYPPTPQYWEKKEVAWEEDDYNSHLKCNSPWVNLHFNPVLDEKNCHYVGVCNRIELFKINYDEVKLDTQEKFAQLWNHPLLKYLRATVNSPQINPICKYCKNINREVLRNTNALEYATIRDRAVKGFFTDFNKKYSYEEIMGIKVLYDNPNSDLKVQHKLEELEN